MSILSTNNKIVRVGDAYSAGSGIDITDRVISVSDDLLNEISAISATVSSVTGDIGSQIDYISGTVNDLSGDIDYISANAGRTYSGIDPIVVNNDENKISAATLQLSAGDNITLTEEGNIVRIDGQAGGLTGDYISGSNVSGFSLQNHLGEPYNQGYDINFTTNAIAGMYLSEYDSASSRQLYLDPEKLMFVENYGTPDQRNETFDANDISALKNSSGYWNEVSAVSSTSSLLNNQITAVRNDLNTVSTNTGYLYNDIQTTSGILSAAIDYVSANAGGTSLTGDAQGALDEVYVNSGTWNDISALNNKKDFDVQAPLIIAEETVSSLKIGISGISADEWNSVYDTVYNGSGSWTGGGGGRYVSGENYVVIDNGSYSSFGLTNISGDVQVVTGNIYDGGSYVDSGVVSLSSLPGQINNKLNASDITNSKTLSYFSNYNNYCEVGGISYKPDGFSGISANVYTSFNDFNLDFHVYSPDTLLYSAKIVVEASNYQNIAGWDFKGYENGSATFIKYFKLDDDSESVYSVGWNNLTNLEASATTYSALSIEPLAFKSDLTGGGTSPTYDYNDDGLISAIDTSGLYAQSAGSAIHLNQSGTMGNNITQSDGANRFLYMPNKSPWTTAGAATGIFSPLQYATGACLAMDGGSYAAYFKGNEWYVSNTGIGQALRGEVHQSRGVHLSGATTAGYSFDLSINAVSGKNNTTNNYNWKLERRCVSGKDSNGEWRYGYAEDAVLRNLSAQYEELKTSYDALSSLIATYSGQWV